MLISLFGRGAVRSRTTVARGMQKSMEFLMTTPTMILDSEDRRLVGRELPYMLESTGDVSAASEFRTPN